MDRGQCPNCGEMNLYTNPKCNKCGEQLPWASAITQMNSVASNGKRQGTRKLSSCAVTTIILILVLGGFMIAINGEVEKSKRAERETIAAQAEVQKRILDKEIHGMLDDLDEIGKYRTCVTNRSGNLRTEWNEAGSDPDARKAVIARIDELTQDVVNGAC